MQKNRHQPALRATCFAREIKTSSLQPSVLLFLCLKNFCPSVKRESRSVASPSGFSRASATTYHLAGFAWGFVLHIFVYFTNFAQTKEIH
jgi:hypothetical protein